MFPPCYSDRADKEAAIVLPNFDPCQIYGTIDTENELDQFVQNIQVALTNGIPYIFRGVSEAKYKLFSSVQRRFLDKANDPYAHLVNPENCFDFTIKLIEKLRNSQDFMQFMYTHNIPVNDMLILSVLQHYPNVSPLLDFSYDLFAGLFFATDGSTPAGGGLDDYISLYYINSKIDWIRCSIQSVESSGSVNINSMVGDWIGNLNSMPDCSEVLDNIRNLRYSQFSDGAIPFLTVEGDRIGITNISIPVLGFQTEYNITNPRLHAQGGLSILNFKEYIPLIELFNSVEKHCQIIHCVDIHKSLIPYIQKKYLIPSGINTNSFYNPTAESQMLESIVTNALSIIIQTKPNL